MDKKYRFTGETKNINGIIYKRIRAIRDFGNIKSGELGGWIEKEENLSHFGKCWVFTHARVCGEAIVEDDAMLCGESLVCENAKVSGNSCIYDDVCISGHARIGGQAKICQNVWVKEYSTVCGNAIVCGDTIIRGVAYVCDNAYITKDEHIISFIGVGSRKDILTAFRTNDGIGISVGCFHGSLDAFLEKVEHKHGDNYFAKEYKLIAEVMKARFNNKIF